MKTKMRLLDLFCGAGGCAKGYSEAGFKVTGVDISPQKRFPFPFVQADALDYLRKYYHLFDVIHASPPCQKWSMGSIKYRNMGKEYPDYISPLRNILKNFNMPYIIENVVQAPLVKEKSIMLCGTMFDLGVFRHRLFETNFSLKQPEHKKHKGKIGDGEYYSVAGGTGRWKSWGKVYRNVSKGTISECQNAMGIDWMTRKELVQAIPPTYTEYIGKALMEFLTK